MTAISEQLRIKWTRWQQAQQYERGFWERLGAGIERGAVGQLDWYKWRAERLEALLDRVPGSFSRRGRVLEIGSGSGFITACLAAAGSTVRSSVGPS